jgi:hypothetical protein
MKVAKANHQSKMDKIIAQIAKGELFIETLETQRSGEDFHKHAVWCIKEALTKAYKEGLEAGKKSK